MPSSSEWSAYKIFNYFQKMKKVLNHLAINTIVAMKASTSLTFSGVLKVSEISCKISAKSSDLGKLDSIFNKTVNVFFCDTDQLSSVYLQSDHFRPPIANEIECEVTTDRISSNGAKELDGIVPLNSGSRDETPFQQPRTKSFICGK